MLIKTQNVYIANTGKDCDLLCDRPVLSSGRMPHDKQNCKCLDYNQNLVMSLYRAQCQDRQADGIGRDLTLPLTTKVYCLYVPILEVLL